MELKNRLSSAISLRLPSSMIDDLKKSLSPFTQEN